MIEQLTKELRSRKEKTEQEKVVNVEHEESSSTKNLKNLHGISFLSDSQEENTNDQLPTKESNPGHFTLPCTIGNFNFYAMADLGASVNVLPRNIFEYLELTNLSETEMLVEMADMRKKAPLGIGGIGDERVTFNINRNDHNFAPTKGIFMLNSISTNEPIIKRLKISDDTATKHFCKPIIQECDKDFKAWPSCSPLRNKCDGVEDSVWSKRYSEWCNENSHDKKPRPRDYTFKEWVIDKSTEALDPDKDPFGRCLYEYNWAFPKEIEQLADEYEIKIGEKGQVLEEIWTKCKRARCKDKDWWYDYWYEDEEKMALGKNGSRFRKIIMEEMEEVLGDDGEESDDKT
ncbi:phospholipase-like protein [Tanacetum coccineum]